MPVQPERVVYPNPSVAHVVLEVRFPPTLVDGGEAAAGLRTGLREDFPLVDQVHPAIALGAPEAGAMPVMNSMFRHQNRDRSQTVAVLPEVVIIETSTYLGFDWYLEFIRGPLDVIASVLQPDAVLTIGHRFIDEVRVPDTGDPQDWSEWIDPCLLAPGQLPSAAGLSEHVEWQGSTVYRTGPDTSLTLRYGPQNAPTVIPTTSEHQRPGPAGPFFLLDWDSRWTPATAPEFTTDEVLRGCQELYAPVRAMYHRLTSDRLKAVFSNNTTGASE